MESRPLRGDAGPVDSPGGMQGPYQLKSKRTSPLLRLEPFLHCDVYGPEPCTYTAVWPLMLLIRFPAWDGEETKPKAMNISAEPVSRTSKQNSQQNQSAEPVCRTVYFYTVKFYTMYLSTVVFLHCSITTSDRITVLLPPLVFWSDSCRTQDSPVSRSCSC